MSRSRFAAACCLVVLSTAACSFNSPTPAEYLASGNRFLAEGKVKEAIIEYRNAIQLDGRFGEARLKLAEAYERSGDAKNAFREYVRAADVLTDREDVQLKAGQYYLAARQFEEARGRAQRIIERSPRHIEAHILLGN